jgi:hypothetical protein
MYGFNSIWEMSIQNEFICILFLFTENGDKYVLKNDKDTMARGKTKAVEAYGNRKTAFNCNVQKTSYNGNDN